MSQLPPRTYGFWTGTFVVAASMVGSGILVTPGRTLLETESPATLFGVYIIGGLMALAGALVVAELGSSLPHAGGDYVFVRQGFGNAWGFVFGWSCLLFTFAAPIALIALLTVNYIMPRSISEGSWIPQLIATAIIAVFTYLHALGQRESGWIQNLTTAIKLAIFVCFALLGFFLGEGTFGNFAEGEPPIAKGGVSIFAMNLCYALYAYSGWNGAAYLAGEIKDPAKNLPRSLVAGCVLVTCLYLLMNALYVFAINPTLFSDSRGSESQIVAYVAGESLFGANISRVLSVVFGIGMVATISALLFTGPRIAFMMARDGLMPKTIGWLHPTRHTPIFATVLLGVISAGMLLTGGVESILDFTSVGLTALSAMTVASIFPLRRRRDYPISYRTPLYPIPPILFLAATTFAVVLSLQADSTSKTGIRLGNFILNDKAAYSIGIILLGFPAYFLYTWVVGKPVPAPEDSPSAEPPAVDEVLTEN